MRRFVAETHVQPSQLVLPLFVAEGLTEPRPITSMPGVVQHTRESARSVYASAAALGLGGVMLFGVPEHKDATGSGALDPDGILNVALRDARAEVGDEVGDGEIDLVTYRRNDRYIGCENCSCKLLFVERP